MVKRGIIKGKKGQGLSMPQETLGHYILAAVILIVIIIGLWIMFKNGSNAGKFIKNLFNFG